MGAKALPTTPLEATDRVADGVLMEVKALAVAAREMMAMDSFLEDARSTVYEEER